MRSPRTLFKTWITGQKPRLKYAFARPHVDYGDIHSVPLNYIHQVIRGSVRLSNRDVCVCYPVLTENGLDLVVVGVRERDGVRYSYAALVFLPNGDRRRLLVQSDPETFEFGFDDFLVAEGLEYVQDDEY